MTTNWPRRIAKEWFLLGMVTAVIVASLFPDFGASGGGMHADIVINVGVALVFFLHGIGLPLESLRRGLFAWRVHLLVQTLTYIAFPLLWIVFNAALKNYLSRDLLLGFCYLAALPSTISSSVAMTALARGDVPLAIFNATLSSLLGIVLTPLIINVLGNADAHGLSLGSTMLKIAELLLLPIIAGQLLRPLIGHWFAKIKRYVTNIDRCVILLLVYAAFCNSVKSGLWQKHGIGLIVVTLAGAAFFLAVILLLSTLLARKLKLKREDEIAAVFCGSKKTLASGIPMAALIFGANPALGVIVLPIMLYHQLQLFVCSILAHRYARTEKIETPMA
ncbi:MAG: bile acid:sodium symporter [Verrucomicrobiaceae bacterium]|nr:bile acid:sodium symporter [Verrucomicrobiaceae bacterium]